MDAMKITDIIQEPEYATAVANWLIEYQNAHGHNINRPPVGRSEHNGIYVLSGEKLVGGLTFHVHNDWIFLNYGYILPEYRGRGIYGSIMRYVERFAETSKLCGVFVSTYDFEAPHVYEHMGFTKGSVLPNLPKGNTNIDYYKTIK